MKVPSKRSCALSVISIPFWLAVIYAASASTTDLRSIAPLVPADEIPWAHDARWWLMAMAALCVIGAAMAVFVRWRIRLNALCGSTFRAARHRR
jgi:hypothetical protein